MRRNPVYTFKNLNDIGIYSIPVNSTIQINDADDLTPGSQPLLIQLLDKQGVNPGSTIRDFLANTNNYANANDTVEIVSELELVQEGSNTGWRLLGVDAAKYRAIGSNAVDLSQSSGDQVGVYGASGATSFATGSDVQAQGENSSAFGKGTRILGANAVALGKYNTGTDSTNILEVGIGLSDIERKNALEINNSGVVKAPNTTVQNIIDGPDSVLITKGFVNATKATKVDKAGDTMTGSLTIQGNVQADDVIATSSLITGTDVAGNSSVNFNGLNSDQSLYFDNTTREFKVNADAILGAKIWHDQNQGLDSGLDADLLDGMQPLDLPVSNQTQTELNLKFDKAGGTITGDSVIQTNLSVQGISTLTTAVLPTVQGLTNFSDSIIISGSTDILGTTTTTDLIIGVGSANAGKSILGFTDTDTVGFTPAIKWDNAVGEFQVDTRAGLGNTLWHSGTFNPDLKLDKQGGTILGNLAINGDLNADGISTLASISTQNIDTVSAAISANCTIGGSIQITGSLQADATTLGATTTSSITNTGTLNVGSDARISGITNLDNNVNVAGSLNVDTNLVVVGSTQAQTLHSFGYVTADGIITTGRDNGGAGTLSVYAFTDSTNTNAPGLYYDSGDSKFKVSTNIAQPAQGHILWHGGNLDPLQYSTFESLTDTGSYLNQAGKYVIVNSTEDGLEYTNTTYDDTAVISRLNATEVATATNASNISTNTADIAANQTDILTHAGLIQTNRTDIDALGVSVGSHDSLISTNATNIATNATDIAANTAAIAANSADIATNAADIAAKKAQAVADIVIDGSETAATNAAKINELLANLRTAGLLAL